MSGRRKYPGAAPTGGAPGDVANGAASGYPPMEPQVAPQYGYSGAMTTPGLAHHPPEQPPHQALASMQIAPGSAAPAYGHAHPGAAAAPDQHAWANNPTPSGGSEPVNLTPYVPEQANLACPPEFLRLTMGCVPQSQELLNACQVPFGAIIHPLAETSESPVRSSQIDLESGESLTKRKIVFLGAYCRAYA